MLMMNRNARKKAELVNLLIGDTSTELEDEELLHLLLQEKLTRNVYRTDNEKVSLGDRMADSIARFAGSWRFILIFSGCLLAWIALNALLLMNRGFDPYPFILLNLILSCVAALQAPVIMMSQNRQEDKDRRRAQNDYKINLKSEIIIEDLHEKLDRLLADQQRLIEKVERLEQKNAGGGGHS